MKVDDEDSFVGLFQSPTCTLNFDCSLMGYANDLSELQKDENVKIDSTGNFIIKTIWPKITGKGSTGVYIHSRKSSSSFQMNGTNLTAKDQELALKAFKTIVIKDRNL